MRRWQKLLERMRANPKGDWTIRDIETVAKHFEERGLIFMPPRRGSHYTAAHPAMPDYILTIPARRPLKSVYVKRFVSMIDSITGISENDRS